MDLEQLVQNKEFKWLKKHENAFNELKQSLCTAPVLAFPNNSGMFIVDTDASHNAIGGVLSQIQDGKEKVIFYGANKLSRCQKKYCVTRKELLAAFHYIKKFKHYLMGRKFLLRTDHKALEQLLNWKKPNTSQFCLWKAELECFDFDIIYREGKKHQNADALSRFGFCKQCGCEHANPLEKRNVKIFEPSELNEDSVEHDKVLLLNNEEDIATAQEQDTQIKQIRHWLKSFGKMKDPSGKSLTLNWFGRKLFEKIDSCRVRGDALYLREGNLYRLVVPKTRISQLLSCYHEWNGHLGVEKCFKIIKERY